MSEVVTGSIQEATQLFARLPINQAKQPECDMNQVDPGAVDANDTPPLVGDVFAMVQRPGADVTAAVIDPLVTTQVALLTLQANNFKTLASALHDWFDFLGHRLEADAAFAEKLVAVKSPQDLAQSCADYWRVAVADYQSEFESIAKHTRRATDKAVDTIQDVSVDQPAGAVMGE